MYQSWRRVHGRTQMSGAGFVVPAAAAGDPSSISGLRLWLKGDDAPTGDVATWTDASGQGNNGTGTGGGATKPQGVDAVLNGHRIVRFDASSSKYFTFGDFCSGFTAGEIFIVIKINTDPPATGQATGLWAFGETTSGGTYFSLNSDGLIYESFGTSSRKDALTPGVSLASWRLYNVRSASGDWQAYLDGTSFSSTGTNTVQFPTAPELGRSMSAGNRFIDGDVAEVIFYNKGLNSTERSTVKSYIATKYALTIA